MTSANDMQIGGTHYAADFQHWDLIEVNAKVGYLEGYATKYLVRHRKSGKGVEDLRKSLHTTNKLLELARASKRRPRGHASTEDLELFFTANSIMHPVDQIAIGLLLQWDDEKELEIAARLIEYLIHEAIGKATV